MLLCHVLHAVKLEGCRSGTSFAMICKAPKYLILIPEPRNDKKTTRYMHLPLPREGVWRSCCTLRSLCVVVCEMVLRGLVSTLDHC